MQYGLIFTFCALMSATALADDYIPPVVGGRTYVQHQIEDAKARHAQIQSILVWGLRDKTKDTVILGSTLSAAAVFSKVAADTAIDGAAVSKDGQQFILREAFLSNSDHRLGTIEIHFAYRPGQDVAELSKIAKVVQSDMRRATLSAKNAIDPFPYDAAYSSNTFAQTLTDRIVAAHPDLLVMMIHATPPGKSKNIIIGSNIGRFGKEADDDDLRVIQKGSTNLEEGGDHDRFETELPLNDASGARIGALGLVFPYRPGQDKEALHARGRAIRDELAKLIPNNAALFAPALHVAAKVSTLGAPLTLSGSTDFPGYTGDFDHFAIDARGGKLFLAGEESAELEVMDLHSGAILQRMKGFGVPHSLLFMPKANELLVIDGEKPSQVFDATTMKVKRSYSLAAGADSFGFDSSSGHIWVVTGGKDVPQKDSNLTEIDPQTGKHFVNVHFDADHVEAMAIEQQGPLIYINVTDKNYLAVIDKATGKLLHQWKINDAEQNAPIAFDEKHRRLFVVTRKPGMLIVLNADTGATIAKFAAPARTDQVTWDEVNRRVYVTGGEGFISVIEQDDADHYRVAAKIVSAAGAKTAILDSANNHLWVAASPGETKTMGRLLRFDVAPR
jgi:DNA-binding beta-propeller fold protein YncE